MASAVIVVENLREREVLSYPLVLLEGRVALSLAGADASSGDLLPRNCFLDARVLGADMSWRWPVARRSGAFKAFVLLPHAGEFTLSLRVDEPACERVVRVVYAPHAAPAFTVRFYYQVCPDAPDGFDAPPGVDTSAAAAIARIQVAALLMQTAMAEMLHAAGYGRRSFALELEDGLPVVRLLQSSFSTATARSVGDQKLFQLVELDIVALGVDGDHERKFKHAIILGCSAYNRETHKAEGHMALGGGKLGIFGSCGLHAWPSRLEDLTACCLDNTRIDPARLLDDSCYRGTHWANFSTGIGAFLHELGHTFGLGHAQSGIMARGFDDMNKLFSVYEVSAQSAANGYFPCSDDRRRRGLLDLNYQDITEVAGRGGAHWNLGSAALLRYCEWISGQHKRSRVGPVISWDKSVRGPVGHGSYDGKQRPLARCPSPRPGTADIGGVLIDAGKYVNRIETRTRGEMAALLASGECRAAGSRHWVVLLEHEYILQVDVRAMAWIDGLQLHTNLRSTRWFGGFGGEPHTLKAAEGYAVSGFTGTRGDHYVGTLAIRCEPVAGGLPFEFSNRDALRSGGAVVIRCGKYVETFRVMQPQAFASSVQNPEREPRYHQDEHVFQLLPGEKLVSMHVKSGHWVDAIRLETSYRTSAWYGGAGGTQTVTMACPPGFRITGFFGSHGQRYLGAIGAIYVSDHDHVVVTHEHGSRDATRPLEAVPTAFSLLGTNSLGRPPPRGDSLVGVLVGVTLDAVTFIESFQSVDECASVAQVLMETAAAAISLHWMPLAPGEAVIQIDASVCAASDCAPRLNIDGVCIHTTSRCSDWLGAFHDDQHVRFFAAPRGCGVLCLRGQTAASGRSLVDITGFASPLGGSSASAAAHSRDAGLPSVGRHVTLARWGTDVRVEAPSSEFSIDSVVVSRRGPTETRDAHAWRWASFFEPEAAAPACHRWCIPQRMLESRVSPEPPARGSAARFDAAKKDLVLRATDTGGWR